MNWTKSIVLTVLAAFLFVGSIGIGIFSKVCPVDGVNVSYFVPGENECCKREAKTDDCGDCCSKSQEEPADDCCDTSVELVKVKLDFLNNVQVKAILFETEEIAPVWVLGTSIPAEEIFIASGSDPPPKLRQEILIDIQQWLI